ncbi:MAG: DUF5689 domain-containing protein [Bacteroidales bacterium]|nr:DUF5689 domain-containing protein [Bacteroidales bacterium]MCL2133708.1 DUF5689 domain-containing protein [Bacteroidales bacterium]
MKTMCSILKFRYLLALFVAVFALCLASCEKNGDFPEMPTLSVDPVFMHFSKSLEGQTINISSNREWFIEQMPEWLAVDRKSGPGGSARVTITAIDNDILDKTDIRVDSFLVRVSSIGRFVVVYQSGVPVVKAQRESGMLDNLATANGQWLYSGDEYTITEIGFAWGADGEQPTLMPALQMIGGVVSYAQDATFKPLRNEPVPTDRIVSGDYSLPLVGLDAATLYKYKAYVKDSDGNIYYSNNETVFTTLDAPTPISIADYRALASGTATTIVSVSRYILGTVITDRAAGNFDPARLVLADGNTMNDVITLEFDNPAHNTFNAGDELQVKVYGTTLANDNYGVMLSHAAPAAITRESTDNAITAVSVDDPANLDNYESMYVEFANTQIAEPFHTLSQWSAEAVRTFMMEVNTKTTAYNLRVRPQANFAGDTPPRGSGTMRGIVVKTMSVPYSTPVAYALMPRNASDIGLSNDNGTRFSSSLLFTMQAPFLGGHIYTEEEVVGTYIMIPYQNGRAEALPTTISVTISGDAADGLEVEDMHNPMLSANGTIRVPVTGTPTSGGTVTFTITGLESWLPAASTTIDYLVTERPAPQPADGNFQAVWTSNNYVAGVIPAAAFNNTVGNIPISHGALSNFTTNPNTACPDEVPLRGKTIASVEVSPLTQTGFITGTTGNWNGAWGGVGWDSNTDMMNPVRYIEFSITPTEGVLDLSGLLFTVRYTAATLTLGVQYAINDGDYRSIGYVIGAYTGTASYQGYCPSGASASTPVPINLHRVTALQNLPANTKITFRIVPHLNSPIASFSFNGAWGTNPLCVNIFGNLTE